MKQTHKPREQTGDCLREGVLGNWVKTSKGITKYKLGDTQESQRCKVEHRECSRLHCNNYGRGQVGTGSVWGNTVKYVTVYPRCCAPETNMK